MEIGQKVSLAAVATIVGFYDKRLALIELPELGRLYVPIHMLQLVEPEEVAQEYEIKGFIDNFSAYKITNK